MCRNVVEPDRPGWQYDTAHAHCMADNLGHKRIIRICNTYCFWTATVVAWSYLWVLTFLSTLPVLFITQAECVHSGVRTDCLDVDSSWNVMAHGDKWEGKWRGDWRMQWVASTLHTTSEHGVSSITTADAHTSAASSRLNWRPPADLNGLVRL